MLEELPNGFSGQKGLPARLCGWNIPAIVFWGENDRGDAIANACVLMEMLPPPGW